MKQLMKKMNQPKYSTMLAASGPTKVLARKATALSSANCVAVYLILHSAMMSANNAIVPIPLQKFSVKAMIINNTKLLPQ